MSAEEEGLFDNLEPCYIDDVIFKKTVEDQGPTLQAGIIAREEGINFNTVLELRLDYLVSNLTLFSHLDRV